MKFVDCKSVYVGGPISLGGTLSPAEIERNLERFYEMESHLQQLGLAVFNPARLPKHNRNGDRATQADYLEQCFWMIMQADGMVALEGWDQSHGTIREILLAQASGKPVFGEDLHDLGYEIFPQVVKIAN